MRCGLFLLGTLVSLASLSLISFGAPPELEHLYPAGAARASTNTIGFSGKFEPWPPKIWCEGDGVVFNFQTNKGRVLAVVAADAAAGPRLVRLFNEDGASEPRFFVVGDGTEARDVEPNDHFRKPQVIGTVPVTINGRLDKNGDVDSFAIALKAGEWLDARLVSYELMSKLDGVLRLVDGDGYQLEWNHDFVTLDPRLQWQALKDVTVVLQVFGFAYPAQSAIELSGGSGAVYRLHLAVSQERPSNLASGDGEKEPNNTREESTLLKPGEMVQGRICPAGDEDRWKIALAKDAEIEAVLQAAALGSPLDAWLKIEDASGKELVRNDDAEGTSDPRLEWKAPAEGEYYLVAGSLTRQGCEDFRYRVEVRELQPDFSVTIAASSFQVTAGETNEVKVTVNRLRGFTNELTARIEGLPEGVSAEPVKVPEKGGEVVMKLVAAENAGAASGPVRILAGDGSKEKAAAYEFTTRTVNNGVPGGYTALVIEKTEQPWLTVKAKAVGGSAELAKGE